MADSTETHKTNHESGPVQYLQRAIAVTSALPDDEVFTYGAFKIECAKHCKGLGVGFPRSDRQFRRWLETTYLDPSKFFNREDLGEILILGQWLKSHPRKGFGMYKKQRLRTDNEYCKNSPN